MGPPQVEPAPTGTLSAPPEEARQFLDRVFDRSSGGLKLEKHKRIWEAVAAAHKAGTTGAGRCVAVIDGGFDTSIAELQSNIHPASVIRPENVARTGGHGTVVAMLIRAVAPDVTLLLLDVAPAKVINQADVAGAIETARTHGADVINLSLEFPSASNQQDMSWVDLDTISTTRPQLGKYLEQVDQWMSHSEPYASTRCPNYCAVCDELERLEPGTLVVAASGNRNTNACPACFGSAVAAAFHLSRTIDTGTQVLEVSGAPRTRADLGRAELLVEEPPGFLGTSFAAPLISGLGALLPVPEELATMAWLERAMTPVLWLAQALSSENDPGNTDGLRAMVDGLQHIAAKVLATHQHWNEPIAELKPCALCALLMTNWYDATVSLDNAVGRADQGLGWARIATRIIPTVASVYANAGLAAERLANGTTDRSAAAELFSEANRYYSDASQLSDLPRYAEAKARLQEHIAPEA